MNEQTPRGASSGGTFDEAKETIRSKAADLAASAKEQADRQFESRMGTVSSEISSIAAALRRAGDELRRENGSSMGASVITTIAERVERFGASTSGRDLDSVLDDVQRLARRNPAAFAGTAAAIGFLAARFLKSSSPAWTRSHHEELAPREYTPGFTSASDLGFETSTGSTTPRGTGSEGI